MKAPKPPPPHQPRTKAHSLTSPHRCTITDGVHPSCGVQTGPDESSRKAHTGGATTCHAGLFSNSDGDHFGDKIPRMKGNEAQKDVCFNTINAVNAIYHSYIQQNTKGVIRPPSSILKVLDLQHFAPLGCDVEGIFQS